MRSRKRSPAPITRHNFGLLISNISVTHSRLRPSALLPECEVRIPRYARGALVAAGPEQCVMGYSRNIAGVRALWRYGLWDDRDACELPDTRWTRLGFAADRGVRDGTLARAGTTSAPRQERGPSARSAGSLTVRLRRRPPSTSRTPRRGVAATGEPSFHLRLARRQIQPVVPGAAPPYQCRQQETIWTARSLPTS